jgi:hypothetical protein
LQRNVRFIVGIIDVAPSDHRIDSNLGGRHCEQVIEKMEKRLAEETTLLLLHLIFERSSIIRSKPRLNFYLFRLSVVVVETRDFL